MTTSNSLIRDAKFGEALEKLIGAFDMLAYRIRLIKKRAVRLRYQGEDWPVEEKTLDPCCASGVEHGLCRQHPHIRIPLIAHFDVGYGSRPRTPRYMVLHTVGGDKNSIRHTGVLDR